MTRVFVVLLTLLAASAASAQSYAGEWTATPLQIRNATLSWGSDCPARLPASQTEAGGTVRVAQSGDHLTFTGAVRGNTRSCFGENPALRRISSRYQNGTWTIICRTPDSDSRGESARYALTASSPDRISFRETTEYDWQLNESRCRVRRTATRTFQRAGTQAEPVTMTEPDPTPMQACTPGPARGVRISPSRIQVAPGERVCFSTRVVDASGCTVPGSRLRLEVRRPEGTSGTLRGRCFETAAGAAESEGTYRIIASSGSFTASARVIVSSDDLSDLVAQRQQGGVTGADGEAEGDDASGVAASSAGGGMLLPIAAGVLGLLLFGALLFFVLGRRRAATSTPSDSAFDAPAGTAFSASGGAPATGSPVAGPAVAAPAPKPAPVAASICPKCGREARDTKFCPDDGAELIDPNDPRVKAKGKICPKCRTGHPGDADTCRNDGTPLILYALYDAQQKLAPAAKKKCPKCGNEFGADVTFCPEDGTRLGS